MTFTSLLIAAVLAGGAADPTVNWEAPSVYVQGAPFPVKVSVSAPTEGGAIEAWKLSHAGFELGGQPLGERGAGTVALPASATLTLEFDLAPHLGAGGAQGSFELGFAGSDKKTSVQAYKAVEGGSANFMEMSAEEIAKYKVLLSTNRGDIIIELWPDVALQHSRNFLDLVSSGFYNGVLFHRVSPSFMIQGGCPNTRDHPDDLSRWGTGNGPRRLQAEFNDRKHVPGVLSAARGGSDINSASCQFFIMTAATPSLDKQYSAFGKVLTGMEAVMRIANAPGKTRLDPATVRPDEPQRIERAYALLPL